MSQKDKQKQEIKKVKMKYTFFQRYLPFYINHMYIFWAVCDHKLRFTDEVSGFQDL